MNEADMQKMMQQMEQMQSCMEKIDEEQLKALEKRSNRLEREVKALCDNGKRDEAQKKAIEFGKEIAKDPSMKQMRQCGEMVATMVPKMAFADENKPGDDHHVCDYK
jgi:hypothetical protein